MNYTAAETRYSGAMPYRRAGASGLKFPAVSLGLWHNFGTHADPAVMREMCRTAFDLGVTHFDLANNYGPERGSAEENFGRILREDLAPYRDELLIATKAGYPMWDGPYGEGGGKKYLVSSLDQSLRRMGLPYVDVFYHHRMDKETPLEETMEALAYIVQSGRALYIGLSRYDEQDVGRAAEMLRALHCPFVVNQYRYSIFDRTVEQDGTLAAAKRLKKGVVAFSPLAQGLLSDRYLAGIPADSRIRKDGKFLRETSLTPERMAQIRALNDLAAERGQTLAQMAVAWLLREEAVTSVLVGASSAAQVRQNCLAAENIAFSAEELQRIDAIAQ